MLTETIGEIALADMRDNIEKYEYRTKRAKTKNKVTKNTDRALSAITTSKE